tara:strand:+ start:188 stop:691 length:504 start_codon:yes stop_codon:yes gene_type:complete
MSTQPLYDEELDEEYEEQAEAPVITMQEQAETHARCLRYWQHEHKSVKERFDDEVARLIDRAEQELGKIKRRQDWHETSLRMYLSESGEKRIILANATLSTSQGRQSVAITDQVALEEWCSASGNPDLIRLKKDPDKTAIMAHIKATGEEPEGVSLIRGDDAFRVKF